LALEKGKGNIHTKNSEKKSGLTPNCSDLLKAIEKPVSSYIRRDVLEKTPLHPCQHAYRAGRSADTALYQLI